MMTQDSNKSLTYIYQILDIPFCVIFQISDFESFSRQKFEFRIEIFSVKSKTKVKVCLHFRQMKNRKLRFDRIFWGSEKCKGICYGSLLTDINSSKFFNFHMYSQRDTFLTINSGAQTMAKRTPAHLWTEEHIQHAFR